MDPLITAGGESGAPAVKPGARMFTACSRRGRRTFTRTLETRGAKVGLFHRFDSHYRLNRRCPL